MFLRRWRSSTPKRGPECFRETGFTLLALGLTENRISGAWTQAPSQATSDFSLKLPTPFQATALDSTDPVAVHRLAGPGLTPARETCLASPGKSGREASAFSGTNRPS